jgi:hypothetical protein
MRRQHRLGRVFSLRFFGFSLRSLRLFFATFAVKGFNPHTNPKILNRKGRKGFAKLPKGNSPVKLCA